jgi:hypothetical protein
LKSGKKHLFIQAAKKDLAACLPARREKDFYYYQEE